MTRIEYTTKSLWAGLWLRVWGGLQLIGVYPSFKTRWFAWVVSQTGFAYRERGD